MAITIISGAITASTDTDLPADAARIGPEMYDAYILEDNGTTTDTDPTKTDDTTFQIADAADAADVTVLVYAAKDELIYGTSV